MISGTLIVTALTAAVAAPVPRLLELSRGGGRSGEATVVTITGIGRLPDGRGLYMARRGDRLADSLGCPVLALVADDVPRAPAIPDPPLPGAESDAIVVADAPIYSLTITHRDGKAETRRAATGPLAEWIDASLMMIAGCWRDG